MNENKNTGIPASENRDSTEPSASELLAQYDAAAEIARATPCDIEGCDGWLHEPFGEPNAHRFSRTSFDEGEVVLEAIVSEGKYSGSVLLQGTSDDMSPSDLRSKADLYEDLPTLMRQYADEIETRQTKALVAQFTTESSVSDLYYAAKDRGVDWTTVALAVLGNAGEK
ncbi:hypothetical protein [Leifsonia poae]|uniref:hypothetical protein n=1 Tax=Leifsonia poae TaxID=110933 RepID=UPI003D67CD0C